MKLFARSGGSRIEAKRTQDLDQRMAAISRSQAVIEFELDGTIVTANDAFLATMGYELDDIRGRHHRMFMDEADAAASEYGAFWRELNEGRFVAGKFQRRARGGRPIWLQASYNPVFGADGRPYRVMKLAVDISEAEMAFAAAEAERAAAEQAQGALVELLARHLRALSERDMSGRIDEPLAGAHGQVKDDYNRAVESLSATLDAIRVATGALRSGAEEISGASDDLSRRTEQQAASLEETAAALDQITATVQRSAASARQAADQASGARVEAARSGEVVQEAVVAMSEIEHSSGKIQQIIGVIDEIAFQTNLLALNAGVEAARAGDAGRGFAVVASEVRALAQRSAEAAKEIKTLIATSQGHVERGVKLVRETGEALAGIAVRVTDMDGLIAEIAQSSQEQSIGLSQVNSAVNQMDQVTQQNAAMVEEATAAAAGLKGEAGELARLVDQFRTGGDGQDAPVQDLRPASFATAHERILRSA
jgi:methyl-accepting chemotaxis protein